MTLALAFLWTPLTALMAVFVVRNDARMNPTHPLLSYPFFSYLTFVALVLVPSTAYFYVCHGDWFLHFWIDSAHVPSAFALLGFLAQIAWAGVAFWFGATLLRNQRDPQFFASGGVLLLSAVVALSLGMDRMRVVGDFQQYHRNFGLMPLRASSAFAGVILWTGTQALGLGFLLYKLREMVRTANS